MNSEEMRVELESFVNAGLRQGWRGWPLKDAGWPASLPPGRFAAGLLGRNRLLPATGDRFGHGSDVLSTRYGLLY